jgi:regulator of replication initiation timing
MQSPDHPCMVPPAPFTQPRPVLSSVAGNTGLAQPTPQQRITATSNTGLRRIQDFLPANSSGTDNESVSITDLTNVEQLYGDPITAPTTTNMPSQLPLTSLDPTLPPFSPRPGPSTGNSQPTVGKGKSKQRTGIATTKEEVALEFSRIEVSTIRARLKTLETKNKELEFQNSILLERVSTFEKAEKDAIYEKYFPKAGAEQPATDRGPSPNNPPASHCHHTHHCCCQRYQCSQQHPTPQQSSLETETVKFFQKSIDEVKLDLSSLRAELNKVYSHTQRLPQRNVNIDAMAAEEDNDEPTIIDDADDSVVTVDEETPGLPFEESLNLKLPTI